MAEGPPGGRERTPRRAWTPPRRGGATLAAARPRTVSVEALAAHCALGLAGALVSWALLRPGDDWRTALPVLSWELLVLLGWTLGSWRWAAGSTFNPYVVFVLAAYLFNGGLALLWAFGYEGYFTLPPQLAPETLVRALALTLASLWALHLGALLGVRRSTARATAGTLPPPTSMAKPTRLVGLLLAAVATLPAAVLLAESVRLAMAGGYFGLYQRAMPTGIGAAGMILASALIPGLFFVLAGSRSHPATKILSASLVVLWCLIQLFLGYRGSALATGAAFAWLWTRRVAPVRGSVLAAAGLGTLFLVVPFIQATRGLTGEDRLNPEVYSTVVESVEAPILGTIAEMGGTLGVTAETMELVPDTRPFDLGASYLYAGLAVLPNLAWSVHPSMARGTPSEWFIWTVEPVTAAAGGGRGFSFIAEAYLNFGLFALLPTALLGFFLGRLQRWAEDHPDEAKDAFLASYLVFFIPYVRADSMVIVRPLVWYAGLPFIAARWLASRAKRPDAPSRQRSRP